MIKLNINQKYFEYETSSISVMLCKVLEKHTTA